MPVIIKPEVTTEGWSAMARYLGVNKDINAVNVSAPALLALADNGHDIAVVLDPQGRASDEYQKRALPFLYLSGINNPAQTLQRIKPAAVIVGLSWPMNLESTWGVAANEFGNLLVHIEDFWGGSYRSAAIPQLIGVIDEAAGAIARERYPKAKIVLSGNPSVRPSPHQASAEAIERMRAFRAKFGRAIVLALGIEADVAPFAAACFRQMRDEFGIILRIHPKVRQAGSDIIPGTQEQYVDYFVKHLSRWKDCIETMSEISTDDVAVCADMVVTGASTVLLTAAQAGVPVVSLWTDDTRRIVYESSGCHAYPPASLGMPCLTKPANLFDYLDVSTKSLVDALRPYDPRPLIAELLS